jgi:hypothetical protein
MTQTRVQFAFFSCHNQNLISAQRIGGRSRSSRQAIDVLRSSPITLAFATSPDFFELRQGVTPDAP